MPRTVRRRGSLARASGWCVPVAAVALFAACSANPPAQQGQAQPVAQKGTGENVVDQPAESAPLAQNPGETTPPEQAPAHEQPGQQKAPKKHPPNRLAKETSPYLLLHAHNPVDWYPWGQEAFDKAKKEKKLIFLSVGYSSCYWCHVMERESFMDDQIAAYLNKHFVCIKVDREERPDVDEIYMTALQTYFQLIMSRQGGGWPLSMFLTPDAKPIAGGTYFPPREKQGVSGFLDVVERVQGFWEKDPDTVASGADQLTTIVKAELRRKAALEVEPITADVLDELVDSLADDFDPDWGGFNYNEENFRIPKFPEPSNLFFLLDRAERKKDEVAEKMLALTLEKMAAGGIHDHVGGGFHRYSTDRFWRVPHFEKMLYDNGLLASVYARAWTQTQRDDFRAAAEGILTFVNREMTDKEGGFYSALDAETDAEEGAFYVWETAELKNELEGAFALFAAAYGVDPENPNFEEKHLLLLKKPLADVAQEQDLSLDDLQAKLAESRKKLLTVRGKRDRPLTDTKVLASWNGLMIRGFADCGRIFQEPRHIETATRAADFVLAKLRTPDGRLLRTYTSGQAKLNAYLDDYAFLADGLIALHQATGDERWLNAANELTQKQIELFWDDEGGGFFFTSSDHEALIARSKGPVDGALPAGNSVAVGNLVYLGPALAKPDYLDRADKTVQSLSAIIHRAPTALPMMLTLFAPILEERKP
ncbi:MAG: DUF255 domain-containing protein [Planctomycetia bacterium]|nr:DUF255 domain-containing protein [Planctomycetia bacterium]